MSNNTHIVNEQQLILAAQQNPDRFAVLYDMHYKRIFLYVYSKIGNQQITADVTSQVFLKAMMGIGKYEYKDVPFVAWLYRIASNEVNMFFRSTKKEQTIVINEQIISSIIDDTELNNSDIKQAQLIDGLNKLAATDSELIDLRFFEQLSFKEIGAIINVSPDNAKVKLYRVIKKLKAIIDKK